MGEICSRDNNQAHFSDSLFQYAYDEDNKEIRIMHDDHIECSDPYVQKNLKDCQERLKKSQKLFKDNSVKTDAIILKSLTAQGAQIKCTFERPYVFLNDSTAARRKSYKIVNKLDSKSSQIVLRGIQCLIQIKLCSTLLFSYAISLIILDQSHKFYSQGPTPMAFIA